MTEQRVFALLGRSDHPTDAVEDYCRFLAQALSSLDIHLEIRRVPWKERGWSDSLQALRLQERDWRGNWVLVQYTALAWSKRGFPQRFLDVLRILRALGARIAVVFHDAEPFGGDRWIDRLRRSMQLRVMCRAAVFCDACVLTVPPANLSWCRHDLAKTHFIPVGANLPFPVLPQDHQNLHSPPAIAVFGITGGSAGDREIADIVAASRFAAQKLGPLRLSVFGRNSEIRAEAIGTAFKDVPVAVEVTGVTAASELISRFAAADLLLFVRGAISSRRGSAIAGIACGLPVIAIEGSETAVPITEAGVLLVPGNLDQQALQRSLGEALVNVLSQQELRTRLAQKSVAAQEAHFAWPTIARRYARFLTPESQDILTSSLPEPR